MGFDKNDSGPLVQPEKKETKVNIGIIIGVVLFIIIGLVTVFWIKPFRV